jgi:DNA-binding CsgD family transcriptional regulator
MSYKDEILKLREDGISYREISKKLGCSLATISYHCKRWNLNDVGLSNVGVFNLKDEIKNYYKDHTTKETALHFNISESSVKKYKDNKRIELTLEEKKERQYLYLQDFRQKLKDKCIEYKGGKCEICGYDKCNRSMDFHHRDPNEKDFGIGSYKILNWNKIKNELNKCDLLCKNCHGELHEKIEKEKINIC